MAILRNTTAITATFEGAVTVTNSVPRGTALSATLSVLDSAGAAADLSDFTALTLEVRPYSTSSVALVQETLASGSFTAAPTLPAVHATFELTDVETNIALGDVASSDLHLVIHGIASAGKVTIATGTITWTEDGAGTGDTPAANPALYDTSAEVDAKVAAGGIAHTALTALGAGLDTAADLIRVWDVSDADFKTILADDLPSGSGDAWGDVVDADIVPDADGTRDLGATATRFAETYTDALDVTNNITVGGTVDGRDIATDGTKLDGIEAGADVTDATNVTAAGALMDSEVTNLAAVKAFSGADYATAAQGATADSALQINPALGTPVSGVATNLTGTAAGLTAGNVTTNANLTGHITSVGNAAVLGSFTSAQLAAALTNETGTGAAVFATSPTLVTPALGTPSSGVATNLTSLNASQLTSGTIPAARIGAATIDAMTEVASGIKSGAGTGTKIITGNGTQTSGEVGVFTAGGLLASSGVVAANLLSTGGALGTPSSGTLTNCTGLPTAGLTSKTGSDTNVVTGTAGTTDYLGKWNVDGDLVDSSIGEDGTGLLDTIGVACSDEDTAITTSGEKVVFYAPYAMTITAVYASLKTAPTVQAVTVDVESPAGTSLLTSALSIATSSFTDEETSMSKAVSKGARVSIDVDQADAAGAASGLKVFLTHTRT